MGFNTTTPVYSFDVNGSFRAGSTHTKDVYIGTGTSDYRTVRIGGGNSDGYLFGAYPRWGDGIHLSYNYSWTSVGSDPTLGDHVWARDGSTSRLSVGYGSIVLAVGGAGAAPTTERLIVNTSSVTVRGTFNNNSDRDAKQHFASVNPEEILAKVVQLPVSTWSYKDDSSTRHIGPMAQDFYSAFKLGTDDKHIAPMDEGGVALAAIQGLNQKLTEELERRDAENADLKRRLEKLEELLARFRPKLQH